jgi:Cu/Ag efflux protein CusF
MKNRSMQVVFRAFAMVSLIAAGASLALAHHSAAAFDSTQRKEITGTVKKFDYSNPHTWVWLDVTNEQGAVETWGVEGMSPNFLNRRGWTRNTLKPGDKLTITIRPMKNGEKGGMWISAKRPDGEVLLMNGEIRE